MKPKYELVADEADPFVQQQQLEKLSVVASLENLMTFPFIETRVNDGSLTLHGLWTDIGEGGLESFHPDQKKFLPV